MLIFVIEKLRLMQNLVVSVVVMLLFSLQRKMKFSIYSVLFQLLWVMNLWKGSIMVLVRFLGGVLQIFGFFIISEYSSFGSMKVVVIQNMVGYGIWLVSISDSVFGIMLESLQVLMWMVLFRFSLVLGRILCWQVLMVMFWLVERKVIIEVMKVIVFILVSGLSMFMLLMVRNSSSWVNIIQLCWWFMWLKWKWFINGDYMNFQVQGNIISVNSLSVLMFRFDLVSYVCNRFNRMNSGRLDVNLRKMQISMCWFRYCCQEVVGVVMGGLA